MAWSLVSLLAGILSTMEGSPSDRPTLREWVDSHDRELSRRLDESASDRERIREALNQRVPRPEYDLIVARVSRLETLGARLLGGLTVIVILLTLLGVILRYVVG